MGLAERQAALDFERNQYPDLVARVEEIVGYPLIIDMDWETLVKEGQAPRLAEFWMAIYFTPLLGALESMAQAEFGRESLQAGLQKVVIQNTRGNTDAEWWVELEAHVLTLDHDPVENAGNGDARTARLVRLLENRL